ncbi:MAG: hypothetical protein KBT12_07825 [Bacteroidales bacterium]|nr:hypothetical protein [Candidatus Physcousia equi]
MFKYLMEDERIAKTLLSALLKTIMLREQKIKELDAQLAEKDGQLAEKDGQLAEKDGQLAEKDGQLAEKDKALMSSARALKNAGIPEEQIAVMTTLPLETIRSL